LKIDERVNNFIEKLKELMDEYDIDIRIEGDDTYLHDDENKEYIGTLGEYL